MVLGWVAGVCGGQVAAQNSASRPDAAFRLIEEAVNQGEIPGAVALVAHRGRIVREAAYGLSDSENQIRCTADTVCWIASVTKPVTTAALMKLVEEGKLRLDDPVEKYLPEFQTQKDQQGRHHAFTIRHLLTHTSGLPGDPPTRKDVFDAEWRGQSVAQTVGPMASARLLFAPGAKVQYSNTAFYVAGRIIEIASGRSYADYVKEKIQYNDFRRVPQLHKEFIAAVRAAYPAEAEGTGVSLVAPAEGGTPRDARRIVRVGQGEFRIRAGVEEGRSVLTHAVSRVDLICRNEGARAQEVTLHLDLSDDGRRTNADNNAFGGMSTRDFLFIQPPGQPWRQVNGEVAGWVSTVRFSAVPGETRIGLSPWYTYGDYLRFVRSVPDHPHLQKTLLGTSDGGREHWELTITDPGVPLESKRTVFWHAREHAYETFSSYALEGLVAYLLSDAAIDVRRRYRIVLHPMTNVDGVAQGYEYRSGYDYPQPRGTATAKLTFDAVDRLRPHFTVTWHNWVAPRDVDCLFYTDSEDGKASRRAWDLFTQRSPSPCGVGHCWESETNPLAKNWFGRSPLNEGNVHQYAMKRYGTQVWGWEMPWWGREEAAARKAGADFGRAFLATVDAIAAGTAPAAPQTPPATVGRWEMHEFELRGRCHVDNPFRDAALVGEFTSPAGKKLMAKGFYDGGDIWRLRFTPDEEGEWRYLLRGEGVELNQRGRLRCVAPRGHGFIRVHPENPYAFAHADGAPFFPMGDTCYGLYNESLITPELRTQYFETRRGQRFNFVRFHVQHSPTHGQTDSSFFPWGGTPQAPDFDRYNPVFFQGLDAMLRQMNALGMNAELILLNCYIAPMNDPRVWTRQREQAWLRYVLARCAAVPNVFLWTIANEYEVHPDGRYRLDVPGDPDWARATARFIKAHDPYRHPVTVHPVISANARGSSTRDPFEPPWRIGEFFGADDAIDVLSQQTSAAYAVEWDEALGCWRRDMPPGVRGSLAVDRVYRKPVLNTENGYEYLRGYPTYKRQVHHTDKVRRASWEIVCAGGYFAAGFAGTQGNGDSFNRSDAPNRYPFVVKDEGAAGQLGLLYDFFTSLPFWRMQPFAGVTPETAVALAEPGRVYVVYLPQGGETSVDLGDAPSPLTARWFNPRDGGWTEPFEVAGGRRTVFQAPDTPDWVLHVSARTK
ncbi:MAG: serine hydrolase [Planctomycetes bacterium]|nr:serine hydrolase [Planctomycetota bacterium]